MAITICDCDRQICSIINNFNENDGLMISKCSSILTNENNSQVQINNSVVEENNPLQVRKKKIESNFIILLSK